MSEASHTPQKYEGAGVRVRPILMVSGGFLLFSIISALVVFLYYAAVIPARRYIEPRPFPSPQLQTEPFVDLEKLQRKQRAQLEGYAKIDPSTGIIRIPIERAMQIIAARGAEAYAPIDEQIPKGAPQTQTNPSTSPERTEGKR